MLRGSSAESFARLSAQQAKAIEGGADANRLADQDFAAVELFRSQAHFRRAATDPTANFDARSAMLREVFSRHFDEAGTELLAAAGGLRWTSSRDLVETFEKLGVIATARAADTAGEGDRLEGEMFYVGQVIAENPPLREALTDRARSVADKQQLLRDLLHGRACAGTVKLAEQAAHGYHQTVRQAFDDYARIATESRGRKVAVVRVARPLSEPDQKRLGEVLARTYDSPVHLNIVVDPEILGGIEVQVGDEVIDGTVASRLGDAGRQLAG